MIDRPRATIHIVADVLGDLLRLPSVYRVVGLRVSSVSPKALLFVDVTGPNLPPEIGPGVPGLLTPIYDRTDSGDLKLRELRGLMP